MDLSTPFDESKIFDYAFEYPSEHDDSVKDIKRHVINQGYLSRFDLKVIGKWKVNTGRNTVRNIIQNSDALVIGITRIALSSDTSDRDRIESLQGLGGVGPAVASAVLHWFHKEPHPIWDRFARRALGFDPGRSWLTFNDWEDYTSRFRGIMKRRNVHKRTLDRALWVFGKQSLDTHPSGGI